MKPRLPLALTMGEPAGIGPDIALRAWLHSHAEEDRAFAVIGDARTLKNRARMLGLTIAIVPIQDIAEASSNFSEALPVLHRELNADPEPGKIDPQNALTVCSFIEDAVHLAMTGGCSGIVTCPIQKETLYGAGFRFEGHTDYLADLAIRAGASAVPVMMLAAGDLRTIPITVHIPLKDVASALTGDAIVNQTQTAARDLTRRFGIANPRIGMLGLNPHAGEGGTIGLEEQSIIAPAIARLKAEGLDVTGPLPGDTAFHAEARSGFDVIVCMYHDQALIPVKTLDFHGGVNVTLGLPFIRTSPDHGTALSLAGKGTANPRSLIAAMELAQAMARHSHP